MNPLPYVLSDLRRSAGSVVAVVGIIAVSVALGVGVATQEHAIRRAANSAADPFDLIVGAPGSPAQLLFSSVYLQPSALGLVPGSILAELSARPEVAFVSPLGFGDRFAGHPIVGVVPDMTTQNGSLPLAEGRPFAALDEAVVGSRVRLPIGSEFTPAHGSFDAGSDSAHGEFAYRVVGRMPPWNTPWDTAILVPIESVWFIHGLGTGHADSGSLFSSVPIGPPWSAAEVPGVPAIALQVATIRDAYVLRSEFRNRSETTAIFPAEVLFEVYALLGDASAILSIFSVATQLLVLAAVLFAVMVTVRRKRRSLAVLRALGAPRRYVFIAVWLGTAIQIVAGVLMGLLLGWGAAMAIGRYVGAQTGLALSVTLSLREWGRAGALVAVSLLLALLPAVAAYRDEVAASLRR